MEKIILWLACLSLKDWLIIGTLIILVFCILEIRRLKRSITQTIRQDLTPQLDLKMVMGMNKDDSGFYIKNVGFFLAKDIKPQDVRLALEDYGFKINIILNFENIESLKPGEERKINFKVFDRRGDFLADFTERAIPHLIGPSFKLRVCYANIEGLKLCSVFSKNREKFNLDKIIYPPEETSTTQT